MRSSGGCAGVETDVEKIAGAGGEFEITACGDADAEIGERLGDLGIGEALRFIKSQGAGGEPVIRFFRGRIGRGIGGANPRVVDGDGNGDALDHAADRPLDLHHGWDAVEIGHEAAQRGAVDGGPFKFVVVAAGGSGRGEQGQHTTGRCGDIFECDTKCRCATQQRGIIVLGKKVAGELEVRLQSRLNAGGLASGEAGVCRARGGVDVDGRFHGGGRVSNPRSSREFQNQRRAKRDRQPKAARTGAKRINGE